MYFKQQGSLADREEPIQEDLWLMEMTGAYKEKQPLFGNAYFTGGVSKSSEPAIGGDTSDKFCQPFAYISRCISECVLCYTFWELKFMGLKEIM